MLFRYWVEYASLWLLFVFPVCCHGLIMFWGDYYLLDGLIDRFERYFDTHMDWCVCKMLCHTHGLMCVQDVAPHTWIDVCARCCTTHMDWCVCKMFYHTHGLMNTVLCVGRVLQCQVVSWLRWPWLYKCVNFFIKLVSVVYTWIRKCIFTDTHTVTELAVILCVHSLLTLKWIFSPMAPAFTFSVVTLSIRV